MKKIIVTGGAGYIGSHMVLQLLEYGYTPIIIDNFSTSSTYNIDKIKVKFNTDIKIYNKNILDNLDDVDSTDVSGIIHFAALKSVAESIDSPFEYYKNNVAGTINLVNFAKERSIKNFVFSSSSAVYGDAKEIPVKEETTKIPLSPYAKTKLYSEEILKDCAKAYGLNTVALRYFNVAGNVADGSIGDLNKTPVAIIPALITAYLGYTKSDLKVFGNDYPTRDGTAIRDYIHVNDLCDAHLKALEFLDSNTGSFEFNLGSKNGVSILELITTFEKITNQKLNYQIFPRREGDIVVSIADSSRAQSMLNWEPKESLESILESSLLWYKTGFIDLD